MRYADCEFSKVAGTQKEENRRTLHSEKQLRIIPPYTVNVCVAPKVHRVVEIARKQILSRCTVDKFYRNPKAVNYDYFALRATNRKFVEFYPTLY